MGKATMPAKARKRQGANDALKAKGGVQRVNGLDINHGGSPVTRWRSLGMLTDVHEAAIAYCWRIWQLVGTEQRTTASYGERVASSAEAGESGGLILRRMEAAGDLERIKGYIPPAQWAVFENCVRFDEPAGAAGSRLGFGSNSAKARAHQVVCNVAETISFRERLCRIDDLGLTLSKG